jgi:hydroxyethylthiazole kinase-like uncharacterized protein yjeF
MNALSVQAIREADRRCIEDLGIPGVVLMNNAGTAVFREIPHGPVWVLCGKGNNGGDGFVTARLALLAGWETHVILFADAHEVRSDACLFMNVYRRLDGSFQQITQADDVPALWAKISERAVLVDALLGTGTRGTVQGLYRTVIETWPQRYTIAVDVPSGLDADTGEPCGVAVRADVTVTFQFMKRGFLTPAAQPYLGRLVVADIGIPSVCAQDDAWAKIQERLRVEKTVP